MIKTFFDIGGVATARGLAHLNGTHPLPEPEFRRAFNGSARRSVIKLGPRFWLKNPRCFFWCLWGTK